MGINYMKQILIVDDSPDLHLILRDLLEHHGYSCEEAENGAEALKYLTITNFDLIITDNHMPVLGGLEFLHQLGTCSEKPYPPVIFLSGVLNKEITGRAIQAGARAVFHKPFHTSSLCATIASLLSNEQPWNDNYVGKCGSHAQHPIATK